MSNLTLKVFYGIIFKSTVFDGWLCLLLTHLITSLSKKEIIMSSCHRRICSKGEKLQCTLQSSASEAFQFIAKPAPSNMQIRILSRLVADSKLKNLLTYLHR